LTKDAYEFLLRSGINDWGGISPVTVDFINPERHWPALQRLKEATTQAGFELRERLAIYPEFVREDRLQSLSAPVRSRVLALVDKTGLAPQEEERW
jgi:FO synthase